MLKRGGNDPYADALANLEIFQGCNAKEMARILSVTSERTVGAGKVVCVEGQAGQEFFVIIDGQVRVTVAGGDLAPLGPGGFFGEMALLDGGPRIATITAITPLRLLVLPTHAFWGVLTDVPLVARRMLAGLARRLRAAHTPRPGAVPPIGT